MIPLTCSPRYSRTWKEITFQHSSTQQRKGNRFPSWKKYVQMALPTISPSWIFLLAKRPHPCIPDRPKQTRSISVLCHKTKKLVRYWYNKIQLHITVSFQHMGNAYLQVVKPFPERGKWFGFFCHMLHIIFNKKTQSQIVFPGALCLLALNKDFLLPWMRSEFGSLLKDDGVLLLCSEEYLLV